MEIIKENIKSDFAGTIIDIETVGNFQNHLFDSRRYMNITPVIFGYMTNESLNVYCAKGYSSLDLLKEQIIKIIDSLPRPFHAFNTDFERGVLYHYTGKEIEFDRELQKEDYEPKRRAVRELGISQYNDPFFDNGLFCMNAWKRGEIRKAMNHNRACLLKERDILMKRGSLKATNIALFR